jgi:hypothetical protein
MSLLHRAALALSVLSVPGCALAVGPAEPATRWYGLMDASLPNLLVCGAGFGFQTQDARMGGLGVIIWEHSTPQVMRIRATGGGFLNVDLDVQTFALSPSCTGGPPAPMHVAFSPVYTGQMALTGGCVQASRLTFSRFQVSGAPPVWGLVIEQHLRTVLHLRLDDWAAAAAGAPVGTTPGPLPTPGVSRCHDWRQL